MRARRFGNAPCRADTDCDSARLCRDGFYRTCECSGLRRSGRRHELAGLVGGNADGVFDGSSLSIYDLSGAQLSLTDNTANSFIGGVHAGYNLQGAHILYGIEGDADFGQDISFLGSLRARLGWAGERVLVYGTTGIGFINADANFTINSPFLPRSSQSANISEVGFVIGGGLDFKVLPRVSLGAEGLWYGFANDEERLTTNSGAAFLFHDHPDMTVVRGRVTYYFNTSY